MSTSKANQYPIASPSRTIEALETTIIGVPIAQFDYHNPDQPNRDATMHIIDARMNSTIRLGLVNGLGRTGVTIHMYGPEPMTMCPRFDNESHEANSSVG